MPHSLSNTSWSAPTGNFRNICWVFPSFCLLLFGCPRWCSPVQRERETGQGDGAWCFDVLLSDFIPGPLLLATGLFAGCYSTHQAAHHHHPAAALLVISHREKPYALQSQYPSSTNHLSRFQNCWCPSAISYNIWVTMVTFLTPLSPSIISGCFHSWFKSFILVVNTFCLLVLTGERGPRNMRLSIQDAANASLVSL